MRDKDDQHELELELKLELKLVRLKEREQEARDDEMNERRQARLWLSVFGVIAYLALALVAFPYFHWTDRPLTSSGGSWSAAVLGALIAIAYGVYQYRTRVRAARKIYEEEEERIAIKRLIIESHLKHGRLGA